MKKVIRIITLVLTISLIAVSSCSCNALDTLKANHGYWNNNGGIILGENEYKLLPYNEYFIPETMNYNTKITITDKDVPVLAGAFVGMHGYISDDGLFIELRDRVDYYCRADKYDEILNRINGDLQFDNYSYNYDAFSEEGEWSTSWYTLTNEQKAVVDNVLNTVTPTVLPNNMNIEYDYCIYLQECSSDMLFRRDFTEIGYTDGKYYLIDCYSSDEGTLLTEVPAEYNSVFEKICERYRESYYDIYSEGNEYEEHDEDVIYDYSA